MLERLKSAPASGGTDTLPLVLLPGTLCDARLFAPVLERLPQVDVRHSTNQTPVVPGAKTFWSCGLRPFLRYLPMMPPGPSSTAVL